MELLYMQVKNTFGLIIWSGPSDKIKMPQSKVHFALLSSAKKTCHFSPLGSNCHPRRVRKVRRGTVFFSIHNTIRMNNFEF